MKKISILTLILLLGRVVSIAQDPDFHIYICFGQSNMEGAAKVEQCDRENISDRFFKMAAVNDKATKQKKGRWYKAVPPLCRPNTGLTPADYFGRTLLDALPEKNRIGIINVAIGGCRIEAFMKDSIEGYAKSAPEWERGPLKAYNNDAYGTIINLAKQAQKDGVIKGILMHQGESNIGDSLWREKVKYVYETMLADLNLKAEDVPLLAGEAVNGDRGGVCAGMNNVIVTLPEVIPTAHIIYSNECPNALDMIHFNAEGYRQLGYRYAEKMGEIMGLKIPPYSSPWTQTLESPIVHRNGFVTFNISAPHAKYVELSSQFTEKNTPMQRNTKGTWSVTLRPQPADIYPYNFIVDGTAIQDPANINIFPNERFKASLLEIPNPDAIYTVRDVPHGQVTYTGYHSENLKTYRPLLIYTPAEYGHNPNKKYPVFYLVSGTTDTEETWFKVGKINTILDNLIADGKAEPMIVVMPYGYMLHGTPRPSSMAAADMYNDFATELTSAIMPFVEKNFRTINNRESRAIAGFSRGGGQSLYTAFANLDKFAWVASYAAFLTDEVMEKKFPEIDQKPETLNNQLRLLWYGVGNSDFLYNDVTDNWKYLDRKGINYKKKVTSGGHTWMNARNYLYETLQLFFNH